MSEPTQCKPGTPEMAARKKQVEALRPALQRHSIKTCWNLDALSGLSAGSSLQKLPSVYCHVLTTNSLAVFYLQNKNKNGAIGWDILGIAFAEHLLEVATGPHLVFVALDERHLDL